MAASWWIQYSNELLSWQTTLHHNGTPPSLNKYLKKFSRKNRYYIKKRSDIVTKLAAKVVIPMRLISCWHWCHRTYLSMLNIFLSWPALPAVQVSWRIHKVDKWAQFCDIHACESRWWSCDVALSGEFIRISFMLLSSKLLWQSGFFIRYYNIHH